MLKLDHFVHIVNCRAENFKVTLASSLKYTGMSDEPPRLMGEGFVILSSNTIDFYYYMDEPGLVPEVPLMVELANGDVVECSAPMWGLDIRCGKGTDFSYGPWADRKREQLYKFFYPPDYQPMKVIFIFNHDSNFPIMFSHLNCVCAGDAYTFTWREADGAIFRHPLQYFGRGFC